MSYRNILSKYIENKYKVSEPVFVAEFDRASSGKEISFRVKDDPQFINIEIEDPLAKLVIDCFQQSFNKSYNHFTVDENYILDAAYGKIKRSFIVFVDKNLETSNPRSTKIFRFFKYDCEKVPSDIMIPLWSYIKKHTDEGYRFINKATDRVHFDNIFNLLKAIESKYG